MKNGLSRSSRCNDIKIGLPVAVGLSFIAFAALMKESDAGIHIDDVSAQPAGIHQATLYTRQKSGAPNNIQSATIGLSQSASEKICLGLAFQASKKPDIERATVSCEGVKGTILFTCENQSPADPLCYKP